MMSFARRNVNEKDYDLQSVIGDIYYATLIYSNWVRISLHKYTIRFGACVWL